MSPSEFAAEHGISPKETTESLQALMAECRKAKIQLSTRKKTVVLCTHAGRAQRVEITREKFEQLTASMLAMTRTDRGNLPAGCEVDLGRAWKMC